MDTVIEIRGLLRRYGRVEAVQGLDLTVRRGRCYGFFGRNGAGKTTTIKCLLNLLRPSAGTVRVFGLDPQRDEVGVKSRLAYVPDQVAFYPWMTVREHFDYLASFRPRWNREHEGRLLARFDLDAGRRVTALSRGEAVQVTLIGAICAEPELLVLDEPTSGLDPLVRREFIRAVIGAYQEADPERRTVFVSTHLISEFEGLIDEFTVIEKGRSVLCMESDTARERYVKLRARFAGDAPAGSLPGALRVRRSGRELEVLVNGELQGVRAAVELMRPESIETERLSLEEIFLVSVSGGSDV
jgi:ABC-2 type transport system ATP-binding protein